MPKVILPNIARSLEKHLMGYSKLLSKPHYNHFKQAVVGICEGSSSMADLGRSSGVPERTWWHSKGVHNADVVICKLHLTK